MKIGILTLPFNNNYGGYLQAYALMATLKGMGHSVTLINRMHRRRPFFMRFRHFLKSFAYTIIGHKHKRLLMSQQSELRERGEYMMPFVDRFIHPKTSPLFNTFEMKLLTSFRFDAIVVGSDQVWRPDYVPSITNYYLDFAGSETRKISYAASFGKENPYYSDSQLKKCKRLIEKFDFVSLREKSGIDILNRWNINLKSEACVVLDPTLLLPREHYINLFSNTCSQSKTKAFVYVLDESETSSSIIKTLCSEKKIEPFHIIDVKEWKSYSYKMPSIEAWLRNLFDSDFVITDSFHGTVFSILFNKPFYVCLNEHRGASRFISLLETFGLTERIVKSSNDAMIISKSSINWERVNTILDEKRKESMNFLYKSLKP